MQKQAVLLVLASALTVSNVAPIHACGDKLLLLGRGIRFQSRHTPSPASVLLYLPASLRSGGTLADPKLESALREAGHQVRAVATIDELQDALRSGGHDVVLADFAEASNLQGALTASSDAVVLPVVYLVAPARRPEAKADAARAEKEFGVVPAGSGSGRSLLRARRQSDGAEAEASPRHRTAYITKDPGTANPCRDVLRGERLSELVSGCSVWLPFPRPPRRRPLSHRQELALLR